MISRKKSSVIPSISAHPKKHRSERAKTGRKIIVKTAVDQITSTIPVADFEPFMQTNPIYIASSDGAKCGLVIHVPPSFLFSVNLRTNHLMGPTGPKAQICSFGPLRPYWVTAFQRRNLDSASFSIPLAVCLLNILCGTVSIGLVSWHHFKCFEPLTLV